MMASTHQPNHSIPHHLYDDGDDGDDDDGDDGDDGDDDGKHPPT